jgi:hypothetical protein
MRLMRFLRTLAVIANLAVPVFCAPARPPIHDNTLTHAKPRAVGGPGRYPDAYIVVLVDGTNLDSHLFWLYGMYRWY